MRMKRILCLAVVCLALAVGGAEAGGKKGGGGGGKGGGGKDGGGGVSTNYGCMTLKAGTTLQSPDGSKTKNLLTATYSCYLCNMDTRVCTIQSPTTLVGWTFVF